MLQSTARTLTKCYLPMSRAYLANRPFRTSSRVCEKDTAFDPQITKPEEQKERAAEELTHEQPNSAATTDANPAQANASANKPRDPQEGGSQGSKTEKGSSGSGRSGPSGGGSPPKAGSGA